MAHHLPAPQAGTPLSGITVIDLSRALAGPHATMMMGDLGARVIKVEPPAGDDSRGWGPPFVGTDSAPESTYFLSANRNKESVVLDLKADADRDLLLDLVQDADVLVENFRAGVLDRLGIGIATLHERNPRLVILSITGFGHDGPEGGRAGYDQIAQGESGLMSVTGPDPDDPQKVGVPISDLLAGMYGAYGVLAALLDRDRTGSGTVVRTSLLSATVGVHAFQATRWTVAGETGTARGNQHAAIAPYGLFRCAGGSVQIAVGSEKLWHEFCAEFGIDPATEGLATNTDRVRNRDRLITLIEDVFADFKPAELMARLDAAGTPAGRIRTLDDVYEWEQTRSQGLLIDVDHDSLGSIQLPGPPLRFFDRHDTEITNTHHTAPPTLDAHGRAIREQRSRKEAS